MSITPNWSTGRDRLLRWYDRRRRDLPWRRTRDPYAIWVSEIMLQQTQVATVLPYYDAFMESFPTLQDLARAPIEEVLARWSGLGYYRRARQLHAAARQLAAENRPVPSSADELRRLPGIGPYTAAAVASIAFGEVVAVLDGNVERVTARLLGLAEDAKKVAVRRRLEATARLLLDPDRPGDGNQALMELGATVCRVRRPSCEACPLTELCVGKTDPEAFPSPRARRDVVKVQLAMVIVARADAWLLLFRRPEGSELLAGMWELPNVPLGPLADVETHLGRRYGGRWQLGRALGQVRHSITHHAITAHVYLGSVELSTGDAGQGPEAAWVELDERARFATSSLVDKALAKLPLAKLPQSPAGG